MRLDVFDVAIIIFEADDVVPTEVIAGLHFDQLQIDGAWIAEPMLRTDWREYGFIGVNQFLDFAALDFGGAGDHDPMLGAVVMHL